MATILKRLVYTKLQDVTLVQIGESHGIEYEICYYLWRGKDAIYYAYLKDQPYKPLCNALDYTTVQDAVSKMILYKTKELIAYRDRKPRPKRLNYILLKLNKLV